MNDVEPELEEERLCVEHYLEDTDYRAQAFARQLTGQEITREWEEALMQFLVPAAARIAAMGRHVPEQESLRGKLFETVLILSDLYERVEGTKPQGRS